VAGADEIVLETEVGQEGDEAETHGLLHCHRFGSEYQSPVEASLKRNLRGSEERIDGGKDKEHDRDDAVDGEEGRIQPAQIARRDDQVLVEKKRADGSDTKAPDDSGSAHDAGDGERQDGDEMEGF